MSVESIAVALHHSRARGATKLVLVGIANHDGDGGAWPSLRTLAKYANVDVRNVRKAIDRLEQLGEVRRIIQQGGDHTMEHYNRPNLYRILLECPPNCDRSRHHRMVGESILEPLSDRGTVATGGDGSDRGTPDASVPLTNLLTQGTKESRPATVRARVGNEERSARSPRAASASLGSCKYGHPYVDRSGGGVPFCAFGCAPDVVGESSPSERHSA